MGLRRFKEEVELKHSHVNLVELWRIKVPIQDDNNDDPTACRPPLNGAAGFASLALRIASIVPNTASTERMFSQLKLIPTAIRNRISHEKVWKQSLVRASVMCTHPMRLRGQKRAFGGDREPENLEEDKEAMSGLPADAPSTRSFSEVMQTLAEDAENDDMLPGALDNVDEPSTGSQASESAQGP
ncbi:hypothetical protein DAEQUDRAFT_805358, partial [Daedalea quercina L-15889]